VLFFADIFPGGGSPLADLLSVVLAVLLFALLYWAIDLIDRI
jgi:preprotein translocase subunit SecE